MRVDFYQLGDSSADAALALIARATLGAGERLLVVSGDDAQLARISDTLWAGRPQTFLAHGLAGPFFLRDRPVSRRQCPATTTGTACAGGVLRLRPQRTRPSIITMPMPGMSPSWMLCSKLRPAVCWARCWRAG